MTSTITYEEAKSFLQHNVVTGQDYHQNPNFYSSLPEAELVRLAGAQMEWEASFDQGLYANILR